MVGVITIKEADVEIVLCDQNEARDIMEGKYRMKLFNVESGLILNSFVGEKFAKIETQTENICFIITSNIIDICSKAG